MTQIFITGKSNESGLGLARFYLNRHERIYSLSRNASPVQHPDLHLTIRNPAQLAKRYKHGLKLKSGRFAGLRQRL